MNESIASRRISAEQPVVSGNTICLTIKGGKRIRLVLNNGFVTAHQPGLDGIAVFDSLETAVMCAGRAQGVRAGVFIENKPQQPRENP